VWFIGLFGYLAAAGASRTGGVNLFTVEAFRFAALLVAALLGATIWKELKLWPPRLRSRFWIGLALLAASIAVEYLAH
jgi:hypothetical protein